MTKSKLKSKKLLALAIIAFIILPTGTPEDAVTSLPLIAWLGLRTYLLLCLVVLALIAMDGLTLAHIIKTGKSEIKKLIKRW